jgi:hypothetical protein
MTDAELIAFVQKFRDLVLDGKSSESTCFVICVPLETLLLWKGVHAELTRTHLDTGYSHFWFRLADGRVLDPTLDQYDASVGPVYFGPPTKLHVLPSAPAAKLDLSEWEFSHRAQRWPSETQA